jgi:hypothetical protein
VPPFFILLLPEFDGFLFLDFLFQFFDGLVFENLNRLRHPAKLVLTGNPRHGDCNVAIRQFLHDAGHLRHWLGNAARQPPADKNCQQKRG